MKKRENKDHACQLSQGRKRAQKKMPTGWSVKITSMRTGKKMALVGFRKAEGEPGR